MRFETWNVRSFYWAGSLVALSKELSKYHRFSGRAVEINLQENTHLSAER
jgi:hypothetical protein